MGLGASSGQNGQKYGAAPDPTWHPVIAQAAPVEQPIQAVPAPQTDPSGKFLYATKVSRALPQRPHLKAAGAVCGRRLCRLAAQHPVQEHILLAIGACCLQL